MRNIRKMASVAVAVLAISGITAGVAVADAGVVSDRDSAVAVLQDAQNDLHDAQVKLDSVRAYLNSIDTQVPPTEEPPVTTTPPVDPDGATAAALHNWGAPIPQESDEFNYVGAPGEMWWNAEGCWRGHDGNGQRCEKNTTVDGQKLVMTGDANGDTGIIGQKDGRKYGRWEARIRSEALDPASDRQYHPLLIIWPDSDRWPEDGEYDFFENDRPGQQSVQSWIHYPHRAGIPTQQIQTVKQNVDTTQWHNIAIEWTPDHVKGFIDGVEWFSHSGGANGDRKNIQDMPSGHLTIQFDNFYGGNMGRGVYQVDWVRTYTL